jgi:hypothetical protein
MGGRFFLGIVLTLLVAPAARGVSTSIPPSNQPVSGPTTAIENLAIAYRALSVDGIDAVLAADFCFHTVGDNLLGFTTGTSREYEMQAARGMLEGVTRGGQVVRPKAEGISMSFDGIVQGIDPEHTDSTQHYQVLTVTRTQYSIRLAGGDTLKHVPSVHVFHVARGDAAVLTAGQSGGAERWYIRRWLEDVSGLRATLRGRKGDCGGQAPPAGIVQRPPALGGALAVRALTNPACAALRIACDLPGSEPARVQVYDVSGRLVNTRQVAVKGPGSVTLDAGAGVQLLPGVYWVRLGQAGRTPSTRMVVVAR